MQYYSDIITEKSFLYLQEMKRKYNFILIGGWAVFLHSKSLKSKDIDIIVDYDVLAKLKESENVVKNERLNKYEINTGNFDIDIYVPHYSDLGVDIGLIKNEAKLKEGFLTPALEILFLMKLYAWRNRRGLAKGQKDELDIFSLAFLPEFDWKKYCSYVRRLGFSGYHDEFLKLLQSVRSVKELSINEQKMAKSRKKILTVIGEI